MYCINAGCCRCVGDAWVSPQTCASLGAVWSLPLHGRVITGWYTTHGPHEAVLHARQTPPHGAIHPAGECVTPQWIGYEDKCHCLR